MRYLFISLALVCSIAIFSCKDKSDCSAGDQPDQIIIGTWELESVYNPWTDETTYPEEEGYTLTIRFKENDTYQLKDSRQPDTETGTYALLRSATEDCIADLCMGLFEGSRYSITCDQLVDDSTPVDGLRKVFSRK